MRKRYTKGTFLLFPNEYEGTFNVPKISVMKRQILQEIEDGF